MTLKSRICCWSHALFNAHPIIKYRLKSIGTVATKTIEEKKVEIFYEVLIKQESAPLLLQWGQSYTQDNNLEGSIFFDLNQFSSLSQITLEEAREGLQFV